MGFDPGFLEHMTSTATISTPASRDGYGNTIFTTPSSPVTFPCHITYKTKVMREDVEERSTSTAQLQAPPPGYVINGLTVPTVTTETQITLPDSTTPRRVLLVTLYTDETTSPHHQTIYLT